jgi:transcriptional regulator GlxA family with amidase domain
MVLRTPTIAAAGRVARRVAWYLLAFVGLPLLVGGWSVATALQPPSPAPPHEGPPPPPPTHDPAKATAVIVAGATGAESVDVLVPYEVLAQSGGFNVYTVAPERRVLPLFPASPHLQGVDFLPHLSLDDYDEQIGVDPDVIVVPFVPSADADENATLMAWLRDRAQPGTSLLNICGGSWVAAEAGLLDGRASTTHQNVLPLVGRQYASVDWIDGQRWVEDGDVVSSAGITAAFDATLRVVEKHAGRVTADTVAERLGYPHLRFLDDPTFTVPTVGQTAERLSLAYRWERTDIGVALYDGVGEVELASVVDLYPRAPSTIIRTLSLSRDVVTTRHGLQLVARHELSTMPPLDRVLIPGAPPAAFSSRVGVSAAARGTPVELLHRDAGGLFPIDAVLHDVAREDNRATAALIARGIEYPFDRTDLAGRAWPYELLLRPLALGFVGLSAAVGLGQRRRGRRRGAAV